MILNNGQPAKLRLMSDRIPILLDTDPGSDIDDALALAYLLRQPKCELLGVTTVTGDVAKRAAIVEVICRAYGHPHIPIHLGVSDTYAAGPGQPNVPHYEAIAHLPHRMDRPQATAVDFLRKTIRSRPGEITLLSIGPLSNVGLLFTLDPEIPDLLKGFVSMAGSYFGQVPEWNCICDPSAAAAAIKRAKDQTLIGLDVTMQCQLAPEDVRKHFANPPHNVLLMMAEKWFESAGKITFHDPLAAAVVFKPEICHFRSGHVVCPMDGKETPGTTMFTEGPNPVHHAADDVNVNGFFDHYFAVVS